MKLKKEKTTEDPSEADSEEKATKKKSTTKISFKTTLNSLQEKDPEFYEFLKQQDADLLNLDDNDNEDLSEDNESDSDDKEDDDDQPDTDNECVTVDEASESKRLREKTKKYQKSLEEALDDSEESAGEDDGDTTLKPLSKKLLNSWEAKLRGDSLNLHIIKQLALAFRAFIEKSGCSVSNSTYQLNNPEDCDLVLQLCFDYFPKVWQPAKNTGESTKLKSKLLKPVVKEYVCDLITFLPEIQDNALLIQILKHVRCLADYCAMFPRKCRLLLKALIRVWNSQTKKCKFFAFQCIRRLVEILKDSLFIFAFKRMYLAYSQSTVLKAGCEMTSSSKNNMTVDYMQKSFAELCVLDPESTYQNAFVYIRQLAVDLRNSIITKKKETFKTVYSRKYANLLYLWSAVLSNCQGNENLKQLIYPLVQVIIGSCRNAPSSKYLPFRIHCIRCLLILTKNSQIFVPVFSLLTEVLNTLNVGKSKKRQKPSNSASINPSTNPINLDTIVKLSKSQLDDVASFKPLIVEKVFDLLIEALQRICGAPAFTELTFLLNLQLKKFCKDGRSNFSNQIRQLSRKLDEHSQWIELYKAKHALNLCDFNMLRSFETECLRDPDNLLLKYCLSCKNLTLRQASVLNNKPAINVENIETKNRKRLTAAKLHPLSNSKKAKLMKKTKKSNKSQENDNRSNDKKSDFAPDIVKDFDMSDLLAD